MTGQQSLMAFHRHLLDDTVRTETFIRAIEAVVKPGDVVVDLGTGSGILAMACCRAGARRVYAIEANEIIRATKRVVEANGMGDTVVFIHKESSRVTLPEPVDLIVSECLGLMGPGDMMMSVVELARRSLREGGRILPERVELFIAPVESSLHSDYVNSWNRGRPYGFDMSIYQEIASNNVYVAWFDPESFLAPQQRIASLRLLDDDVSKVEKQVGFRVERSGQLHGFCGWFEVELGGGVRLNSSPSDPATIWKQVFLPLEQPVHVEAGTEVRLDFGLVTTGVIPNMPGYFRWETALIPPGAAAPSHVFKQSSLKSIPRAR
ncbi:50S ribosomal protein L11 methyltransferase [Melittangium boletus]|nr:50S ribosomal protein L11 methyltransferase [Melittangium boletus]